MTGRQLFVAGAHTDVGKTHVACALLQAARQAGLSAEALKPVVSGFEDGDPAAWARSDPGRLLAALDEVADPQALAEISPWRFKAPLAPPMAASLEGLALPLAPIVELCRRRIAASTAQMLVVEGVGGLMSPIADHATGLDLMCAIGLPTILVGGAYLGAISHTLTALEVLRAMDLSVIAVVISGSADPDSPDFAQTVSLVQEFSHRTLVISAPRDATALWPQQLLAAAGLGASAPA